MKDNIENILNDVVNTISAALNAPEKPIERESSWTETLVSLLNLMIGELFPVNPPVAFFFNPIKQKSYLKIGFVKRHPLSRDRKMVFETLLKQIEKMKQLFLTESAWQLTRDSDSYFIPAIPNKILVAWLALCIKQINTSHPIENGLIINVDPPNINVSGSVGNLLRLQFGFNSICTQDEHAILQQLHNELKHSIEQSNLLGDLQNDDLLLKQLEYCEKISTVISNRITARSLHHYNQLMKAQIKLRLVSNILEQRKLQSIEPNQFISHLNYIEHTCTNLPLDEVDDYHIPLIIEDLLQIMIHYPIVIDQSTTSEVENNNTEKPTINIDMLQETFDRIMRHCTVCINEDNNKRLDIICDKLQICLTTCLHELTTPPSLVSDKIITMLNHMFKLITPPPYRAWQNTILNTLQKLPNSVTTAFSAASETSDTAVEEEDGLEMMRATFDLNRRFGYAKKPVTVDDLCKLASDGEFAQLKLLISDQTKMGMFNVNTSSTVNLSLLQYSVAHNNGEVVKLLLKSQADVNCEDGNGVTPLMWTIKCDHPLITVELVNHGASVNSLNSQGYSPLHFAAFFGKEKAAKFLLDNKADIDQKIEKPKSKLSRTKTKLKVPESIPYYNLDKKLPRMIEEPNEGDTALHIALRRGNVKIAALLLERDADPNMGTKEGVMPLALAAQHAPDALPILIEKGAKIVDAILSNKVSHAKMTQYLYQTLQHTQLKECIIAKPSIATENFENGTTLLHLVIQKVASDHDKELLQLIMIHCNKMDCNKRNKQNQKAIHLAIEVGIADEHICHLAKCTTLSLTKRDPLSVVELCLHHKRSNSLIRFLLEHGANANDHAASTEHPLTCVVKNQSQNIELLTLLLDHHAWLDSDKEMENLLSLAKANKVDASVLNRIASKIAEQQADVAEKKQLAPPIVELLEPRPIIKVNESIQYEWDRIACWDATGNRWEQNGKPDEDFYSKMHTFFISGRNEGIPRDQIIAERLKGYIRPQKATAPKVEKVKAVTAKPKTVAAVESCRESKPQPQSIPTRPKKASQLFAHQVLEPTIDWGEPVEPKKKKKQGKNKSGPYQAEATANEILPIQLADNEALFLEDMRTWRSKIEKPTQLHDEICEDVIKFSMFLIFLGIGDANELRNIELNYGEHNNNAIIESVFTANDADAPICRNNVMHKFPTNDLLVQTYETIICNNIGPRLRSYQKTKTILRNLPAVDLSRGVLFHCEMADFNVNAQILELFRRISNYEKALKKEFSRQVTAFKLLHQQDHAKPIFVDGKIDYTLVDVYTARAVESCLVWLGKCHTLYNEQDPKLKTLPSTITNFLADVYKRIRNIFAHEIADNAQWHYSPIDVNFIQEYMKVATEIFKTYQTESEQKAVTPQNRLRMAFSAQPFAPPNAGNNNNAETPKAKLNPFATPFEFKKG